MKAFLSEVTMFYGEAMKKKKPKERRPEKKQPAVEDSLYYEGDM